jgi:ribosome-associated protein
LRLNKTEKAAVTALEDIKATDITPLDTRTLTSLYDTLIIATAESARQTKALARNVADKVRAAGGYVRGIEGEDSGEWVIVDCGDLVVHVMLPQTRMLYNLEELWTPSPASNGAKKPKVVEKKVSKVTPLAQSNGAITRRVATSSKATKSTAATPSQTKKPATKKPSAKKPAVAKVVKKPAAKKPAAKSTTSKNAVTKKPAAKKPAAKKPTVKKPATKKPAVKKPASKK